MFSAVLEPSSRILKGCSSTVVQLHVLHSQARAFIEATFACPKWPILKASVGCITQCFSYTEVSMEPSDLPSICLLHTLSLTKHAPGWQPFPVLFWLLVSIITTDLTMTAWQLGPEHPTKMAFSDLSCVAPVSSQATRSSAHVRSVSGECHWTKIYRLFNPSYWQ